jgi:GAF domain-containing protein
MATSEILRVISQSQTDVQPVFETVVENAVRICEAARAFIFRFDGELLRAVASYNASPELRAFLEHNPLSPGRHSAARRVAVERRTLHIPDVQVDPEYTWKVAQVEPLRTLLGVPILKGDELLGVIITQKREVAPFTDTQIALVETFADQAVIAIENVRLFNETKEALEQQTATSEILRVISDSPTDVQPVFDAIIKSAVTLCNGVFGSLDRFDGDLIYPVATHNYTPEALDAVHRMFPARPSRSMGVGRAILNRDVIHIPDVELDPEYKVQNLAGTIGFRSGLFVPMLQDGVPIGVILVGRSEPGPFSDNQIALLKTFADQAVIAIENVRLFKELQEKNRALTEAHGQVSEALEQQTATSEILRVISAIHTDAQPVFDTIVQSAVRLCKAVSAAVFLTDGRMLYEPANYGDSPEGLAAGRARYPRPLDMDTAGGIAVLTRSVVHVPDTEDPRRSSGYSKVDGSSDSGAWSRCRCCARAMPSAPSW